jgi:hypothetical protein
MTSSAFRKIFTLSFAILAGFCLNLAAPMPAQAQIGFTIAVGSAPPPLPYYEQPFVPGPDYLWAPGYWAWESDGYYWVPGAWVLAPRPGLFWTPGYWAWNDGAYYWYPGYWGRRVGYYGGINYGYGYYGRGYVGGRWYGPHFRYNTLVTRVNTRIVHNVYVDKRVVINNPVRAVTRVSYNGGGGGIAQRLASERVPRHEIPMTTVQREHEHIASIDRNQFASITHNQPRQLVTERAFSAKQRPATFERLRPADRVVPLPTPVRTRPQINPNGTPSHVAPSHVPGLSVQQPPPTVPPARVPSVHSVPLHSDPMRPARVNPAPMHPMPMDRAPVRAAPPARLPPPRVISPRRSVAPSPSPRQSQSHVNRERKSAQ